MKLTYLWKDPQSGNNHCPALYATDGGYVVQGSKLDDTARVQLRQLADNEDAVYVPAAVLDLLKTRS